MKRIAIVSGLPKWEASVPYERPASTGHYVVWLSAVCKALEYQREYDIHWVILDKTISEKQTIETRGQTFHLLPKARSTVGLVTGYLYDTWIILQALKRISPDLVHTWGTENSFSLAVSHYCGKKLLSIQGLLKVCSERARIARFERIQALYEPYTIRKYKHITTESAWAADRVKEIYPNVNPMHLEYAVEDIFFSAEHVLSETPTCLYGGSDTPVKNISTLIKAFSCQELSHVRLKLAGVKRDKYPEAPENITFLGHVNRAEMVKLMSESWCLVHPSLADTGPTIAKEARVMGLPVMLTSACGSMQHIVPDKSGYIVEPYDINGMRESVLKMTVSRENAEQMGKYQQEEVRKALNNETMVKALLGIYAKIID